MNFPVVPFDDSMFSDYAQTNPYWEEELRNLTRKHFVAPKPAERPEAAAAVPAEADQESVQVAEAAEAAEAAVAAVEEDIEVTSQDVVMDNIDEVKKDAIVTEKSVSSTTWTWVIIISAVVVLYVVATLRAKKLRS